MRLQSALPTSSALLLVFSATVFSQQSTEVAASSQAGPPSTVAKPQSAVVSKQGGKAAGPPKPPAPPKPPWQEFKLNPKTTMFLDFTDANPDMIISIFARTSGITILKDPAFKTTLTVTSAKSVGLNEAFEIFNTVLGLNSYELRKEGHLLIVSRKMPPPGPPMPPPPPPEVPVVKTYALQYASAVQVARVVNEVFAASGGGGGGSQGGGGQGLPPGVSFSIGGPGPIPGGPGGPGGGGPSGGGKAAPIHASSEDYSNAVIVSALPKDQIDVEKMIKDLDKPSGQPLESKIFRLKHVAAEDVVQAIMDVLTANAPTGRGAGRPAQPQNQGFSFFDRFSSTPKHDPGGQYATAIKQTNSVIVTATKENLDLVSKLVDNLDVATVYVGSTFVVHLENAKASDVATLLNQVFTAPRQSNQNDGGFFFFGPDFGSDQSKKKLETDIDEQGNVVNIKDLYGKVNVMPDPNTNSLIVVTQPSNMKMVREIIDQIDHISAQVMIETIIVEANLDKTTKLGVEWSFLQNKVLGNSHTSANGAQDFGLASANPALEGLRYTITGSEYKAFVNALQTDSRFKVLDTPRIFTSNNVKAEINVSQKVPYITSQQTGITGGLISQYDFLDVGVVLTVTPRVAASGEVVMDVVQSADDLQGFTTFNAPIVNHRQASTTVSVKDGETIVLGGIIRNTTSVTENKIPILGDIPLIGNLFKSTSRQTGQTELMVFLTPHIVRSAAEAQKLREEETKRLSKSSQDAVKPNIKSPTGGG